MKGVSFFSRPKGRTQQNQEAKNGHIIHLGQALGATKKGSFERALAVGRALERRQVLRDAGLADKFQKLKPKKKHRQCRIKDEAMQRLVLKYTNGEYSRNEYALELMKTVPRSDNTSK